MDEYSFRKFLLIEFIIPNLRQGYVCIAEIFKTDVLIRFLSTKSSFEFTKVILKSKSWCEMFVLKLSGLKTIKKKNLFNYLLNYLFNYLLNYLFNYLFNYLSNYVSI